MAKKPSTEKAVAARGRAPRHPKLDEKSIVDAAFALLAEEGLEGLNLRNLALRLGVQASAFYWHVGSKAELLGMMAVSIYGRAIDRTPARVAWRNWLQGFGQRLHEELMSHRDSAQLCVIARPVEEGAGEGAARLVAPLVASGLGNRVALNYVSVVISFTLGSVMYEQSTALHDLLSAMVDLDECYLLGLNALVDGLPEPTGKRR